MTGNRSTLYFPCVAKDCVRYAYKSHVVCFYHLCWEVVILGGGSAALVGVLIWGVLAGAG